MLSGDWYHRKGTASVPAHGGTCDTGFNYSRTLKKGTTLARERRQEQSAVYPDRLQLKNNATRGNICPLGGVWIMSLRRMQKVSPEEILIDREKEPPSEKGGVPLSVVQHLLNCCTDNSFITVVQSHILT